MQPSKWPSKLFGDIKIYLSYSKTLKYLLKKRGLKAFLNFLYIKSFIMAGEGTLNLIGEKISEPLFKMFPRFTGRHFPYPSYVEIEITNKCNKKCIICEHTYWKEPPVDLTLEQFKQIISQFPTLKWVNLTGEGDAFLNKEYIEMIRYLKEKDVAVFLVDSLDLLGEETQRKIIEMGVEGIFISWDGATKETYEKIKCGCSFDKSLNNLKNILKLKQEYGSPIPEIRFRYVVTSLNVNEMSQFIELVSSLGGKETLGEGSHIEFANLLVFDEVRDIYIPEIDSSILQAAREKGKELNIDVVFSHISETVLPPLEKCRAWGEPYIMMGGYVMPCCAVLQNNSRDFLRKHALGNILEKPFKEIWNSERYIRLRESIPQKKEKVPLLCCKCRAFNTKIREEQYGIMD